jgi:peptidyl-tRNA hydrolase, PTH2 family
MNIEQERKQWIIARKDLNMPPGKLAAQVAHASMAALLLRSGMQELGDDKNYLIVDIDQDVKSWLNGQFTKVVLEVDSEEMLLRIYNAALLGGRRASKIVDNGLTVFKGQPTLTCVGLGPHIPEEVNYLIGHLKTYR